MKKVIHKAESRGHFNFGWLDTYHTFSFARYYDPERVNFGALRVLNDDIIEPSAGFGKHPHDNMEIISVPIYGSLKHADSTGHEQVIHADEVQVMSAGTGIFHSEFNASKTEKTNLLQIWILPKKKNVKPAYDQKRFDISEGVNKWQLLVHSSEEEKNGSLQINQDARISRVKLEKSKKINYSLNKNSFGSYLFVIEGEIAIDNEILTKRDGIGIYDSDQFEIVALEDSVVLNIEVPGVGE